MSHNAAVIAAIFVLSVPVAGQTPAATPKWIGVSNNYTNMLLAVQMKHDPEFGSEEGLSEFDTKVSQPTLADEDQDRQETEDVLAKFKAAAAEAQQEEVEQDLQILIRAVELGFKREDFQRAHVVPFANPSKIVFG
ncbi:MAG: hypothetical protein WBF35_14260, partial [Candidatus Acidiferrales bacterium]